MPSACSAVSCIGANYTSAGAQKLQLRTGSTLLEVTMGNIYPALFDIMMYPFTSGTDFVLFPCMLCFFSGMLLLLIRIIKGKF